MVVGQGAQIAVAGVLIGLVVARLAARALDSLVFGVSAIDLSTFAVVAGAMLVIAFLASYLPARRASNVDPLVSLRGE
jgi:putative ABC transport system permease protein